MSKGLEQRGTVMAPGTKGRPEPATCLGVWYPPSPCMTGLTLRLHPVAVAPWAPLSGQQKSRASPQESSGTEGNATCSRSSRKYLSESRWLLDFTSTLEPAALSQEAGVLLALSPLASVLELGVGSVPPKPHS